MTRRILIEGAILVVGLAALAAIGMYVLGKELP